MISGNKLLKKNNQLIFLIAIVGLNLINQSSIYAQQSYPVVLNTIVEPPYSPYFEDYFSASSNKWKSTIIFNDFSEPYWEVKLKVTIENSKIKIQTRPEFIPPLSIRVFPGVPYTVSGADLAPYFEYHNLILNGITAGQLSQNGRLPEGFYSFCIEILDYKTGTPISLKSCSNFWIQLNDEPITLTPACGTVIRPNPTQNIIFQWQQANAVSPNSLGTEYQLVLYEITDPLVNPLNAIQNNKVLKIFESEHLNQTTFLYDMTAPILDIGKKYIYTIHARDIEGKDIFKNKGVSQSCWFGYGYPNDGMISLIQPNNQTSFLVNDPLYFKWKSPSKTLPGQMYSYKIKIVKLDSNQTPEEAIISNNAWYEETTNRSNQLDGYDILLKKKLEPQRNYAWQVIGITDEYEIAKSPVYTFFGPGIIERFLAGKHEVIVRTTFNNDLNKLSGIGEVQLSKNGRMQEVNFSNLRIVNVAGRYALDYGVISDDLLDSAAIELTPELQENRSAYFHPKKFKLDKNDLKLYGYATWELPHMTTTFKKAYVVSKYDWINFDAFELKGNIHLNEKNQFALLDPYNFKLEINTDSDFLIDYNKYYFRIQGDLVLPTSINGTESSQRFVKIPFHSDQLYYITNYDVYVKNNILPLQNSKLVMAPTSFIIDLSETESPLKLSAQKEWKGIYFPRFKIIFNKDTDQFGELMFSQNYSSYYQLTTSDNFKNWIGSDGLNLSISKTFTNEKSSFNQFPANLKYFKLEIEKNSVQNSFLKGSILIPFISTNNEFIFTAPIMNTGFQPGYLDSLDGTKFTFNKGAGENEINIEIIRAVFTNRERLDMTLDLDWPGLDIQAKSLTGFRAWGNYNIGFLTPNGTQALSNQLNGKLRGYPVVFDGIGAGNSNGAYAFGLTGKAVLGDDISGNDGPPAINIYSTAPNSVLPQISYVADAEPTINNNNTVANTNQLSFEENVNIIKNDFINRLNQSSAAVTDNSAGVDLSSELVDEGRNKKSESGELINPTLPQIRDTTWGNIHFHFDQQKLLDEALTGATIALSQPFTDSIKAIINKHVSFFTEKVDKVKDTLNVKIEREVKQLLDTLAARTSRKLKKEDFDPTEQIQAIADSLAIKISSDIKGKVNYSIDNNIKYPVTTYIDNSIESRTNAFIESQIRTLLLDLIHRDISVKDILNKLIDDLPILIHGIGDDAFAQINMERMKGRVYETGRDVVGDIKVSEIDKIFIRAINAQASYIVSKNISKATNDVLKNLTNGILEKEGGVTASAGLGVKMNFENLGRNLKDGKVDQVVKLDMVSVALETKFLAFAGLLHFSEDDPLYGDIWKGAVNLHVIMPRKFSLGGIYVNGRKGETPFWFCQISGTENNKRPGDAMDRTAKPLSDPVSFGPVKLMGASGRLFYHMKEIPGQAIIPDPISNYGAGVNFVFFDSKTNGNALRLAVGAQVEMREDGNYVIDFEGDAQVGNKNPQVILPDPFAMGGGGLHLNYNSAEAHFLGEGWMEVKHKVLCAKGNFLVDMKPDYWNVQLGRRENMIRITPGCAGWGAAGWIGVNPTVANVGLGLSYSLKQCISLNLDVVKGGICVDAGLAAGIDATVQYKPDVKLLEAGVWAEVWAGLMIYYETKLKSGSLNLVNIYCSGNLNMKFDPPPTTLGGTLHGHVEILCFGVDFDAGFEKSL